MVGTGRTACVECCGGALGRSQPCPRGTWPCGPKRVVKPALCARFGHSDLSVLEEDSYSTEASRTGTRTKASAQESVGRQGQ